MPFDSFADTSDSLIASSRDCFSITPSDVTELPKVTKALYVGTGGNLALRSVDGADDVILRNVPSGAILDIRTSFVRATGTSAADLIGLA